MGNTESSERRDRGSGVERRRNRRLGVQSMPSVGSSGSSNDVRTIAGVRPVEHPRQFPSSRGPGSEKRTLFVGWWGVSQDETSVLIPPDTRGFLHEVKVRGSELETELIFLFLRVCLVFMMVLV